MPIGYLYTYVRVRYDNNICYAILVVTNATFFSLDSESIATNGSARFSYVVNYVLGCIVSNGNRKIALNAPSPGNRK